ncbi:MAG: hypothetical protein ACLQBB_11045 [Solirubrobacteraceae bacterium]
MPSEDIDAARRAVMVSARMLEALAASPDQDEDVSLYAVQCFDRAAVVYVQRIGKERAEDALKDTSPAETRPRFSSLEGARASDRTAAARDQR